VLLLLSGCAPWKVRPMFELEHRRSHELETRAGVRLIGPKGNLDIYTAPILEISDHRSQKVDAYWSTVGVRWIPK
jgi:hypothetical protein